MVKYNQIKQRTTSYKNNVRSKGNKYPRRNYTNPRINTPNRNRRFSRSIRGRRGQQRQKFLYTRYMSLQSFCPQKGIRKMKPVLTMTKSIRDIRKLKIRRKSLLNKKIKRNLRYVKLWKLYANSRIRNTNISALLLRRTLKHPKFTRRWWANRRGKITLNSKRSKYTTKVISHQLKTKKLKISKRFARSRMSLKWRSTSSLLNKLKVLNNTLTKRLQTNSPQRNATVRLIQQKSFNTFLRQIKTPGAWHWTKFIRRHKRIRFFTVRFKRKKRILQTFYKYFWQQPAWTFAYRQLRNYTHTAPKITWTINPEINKYKPIASNFKLVKGNNITLGDLRAQYKTLGHEVFHTWTYKNIMWNCIKIYSPEKYVLNAATSHYYIQNFEQDRKLALCYFSSKNSYYFYSMPKLLTVNNTVNESTYNFLGSVNTLNNKTITGGYLPLNWMSRLIRKTNAKTDQFTNLYVWFKLLTTYNNQPTTNTDKRAAKVATWKSYIKHNKQVKISTTTTGKSIDTNINNISINNKTVKTINKNKYYIAKGYSMDDSNVGYKNYFYEPILFNERRASINIKNRRIKLKNKKQSRLRPYSKLKANYKTLNNTLQPGGFRSNYKRFLISRNKNIKPTTNGLKWVTKAQNNVKLHQLQELPLQVEVSTLNKVTLGAATPVTPQIPSLTQTQLPFKYKNKLIQNSKMLFDVFSSTNSDQIAVHYNTATLMNKRIWTKTTPRLMKIKSQLNNTIDFFQLTAYNTKHTNVNASSVQQAYTAKILQNNLKKIGSTTSTPKSSSTKNLYVQFLSIWNNFAQYKKLNGFRQEFYTNKTDMLKLKQYRFATVWKGKLAVKYDHRVDAVMTPRRFFKYNYKVASHIRHRAPWFRTLLHRSAQFQNIKKRLGVRTKAFTKRNKIYSDYSRIHFINPKVNHFGLSPRKTKVISYRYKLFTLRVQRHIFGKNYQAKFLRYSDKKLKSVNYGRNEAFLAKILNRADFLTQALNWAPNHYWARYMVKRGLIYKSSLTDAIKDKYTKTTNLQWSNLFPLAPIQESNDKLFPVRNIITSPSHVLKEGEIIQINPNIQNYLNLFLISSQNKRAIPLHLYTNATNSTAVVQHIRYNRQFDYNQVHRITPQFLRFYRLA